MKDDYDSIEESTEVGESLQVGMTDAELEKMVQLPSIEKLLNDPDYFKHFDPDESHYDMGFNDCYEALRSQLKTAQPISDEELSSKWLAHDAEVGSVDYESIWRAAEKYHGISM